MKSIRKPSKSKKSITEKKRKEGESQFISQQTQFNQIEDSAKSNKLDQVQINVTNVRRGSLPSHTNKRAQSISRPSQAQIPITQKPFYEQTFYISRVRDNYLTLISDNMETLQLPLGLITENIKIGCPIKLKLQYDYKRQQNDQIKFKTVQKQLYQQFRGKSQSGKKE